MIANWPDRTECEDVLFNMMQPGNDKHLEDVLLLTGFDKDTVKHLWEEARKCTSLDSACSSTVCGVKCMDDYLQSSNLMRGISYQSFKFKTYKFRGHQGVSTFQQLS